VKEKGRKKKRSEEKGKKKKKRTTRFLLPERERGKNVAEKREEEDGYVSLSPFVGGGKEGGTHYLVLFLGGRKVSPQKKKGERV